MRSVEVISLLAMLAFSRADEPAANQNVTGENKEDMDQLVNKLVGKLFDKKGDDAANNAPFGAGEGGENLDKLIGKLLGGQGDEKAGGNDLLAKLLSPGGEKGDDPLGKLFGNLFDEKAPGDGEKGEKAKGLAGLGKVGGKNKSPDKADNLADNPFGKLLGNLLDDKGQGLPAGDGQLGDSLEKLLGGLLKPDKADSQGGRQDDLGIDKWAKLMGKMLDDRGTGDKANPLGNWMDKLLDDKADYPRRPQEMAQMGGQAPKWDPLRNEKAERNRVPHNREDRRHVSGSQKLEEQTVASLRAAGKDSDIGTFFVTDLMTIVSVAVVGILAGAGITFAITRIQRGEIKTAKSI